MTGTIRWLTSSTMTAGLLSLGLGTLLLGCASVPLASVLWPPLTTVHQPLAEMAAKAVEIMTDHIRRARSGSEPQAVHHVAPFTIIERGSTAPPGKTARARAAEAAYQ